MLSLPLDASLFERTCFVMRSKKYRKTSRIIDCFKGQFDRFNKDASEAVKEGTKMK